MNKKLHERLLSEVKKLKIITSSLKLGDLVNVVAMEQFKFNHNHKRKAKHLSSPFRQGMKLTIKIS